MTYPGLAIGFAVAVFKSFTSRAPEPAPGVTVVSTTISETRRSEESVGNEHRKIDNSRSGTTAVRRMSARRRWTRKCELILEEAGKQSKSGELKIGEFASLRADVEREFRKRYSSAIEEEQSFSEEIEITVPPRVAVDVVLHWKNVWQEGVVVLELSNGESFSIPYRELVGLTFDQENHDSS